MIQTIKRYIALILALSMCFSLLTPAAWATALGDTSQIVTVQNEEPPGENPEENPDGSTSGDQSAPEEAPDESPDRSEGEEPQEAPALTDALKEKVGQSVKESKEAEEAPKESEEQSEETPAPKALKGAKAPKLGTQETTADFNYRYYDTHLGEFRTDNRSCTFVEGDVTGNPVTWTGGWYAVNANFTISGRIVVEGEVHLILCDGAKLTASKGITVQDNDNFPGTDSTNILNIYAQSEGADMGQLVTSTVGQGCAGIGDDADGNQNPAGTITIHGGRITATGGNNGAGMAAC